MSNQQNQNNETPPEGKKFVMDGARIKCSLCSKPEGKLRVTSNALSLQDMIWANINDTNGAENLVFNGVCNHSKYGDKKPPCQSVIQPKGWSNPASATIQDAPGILQESQNFCTPHGNQLIEIVHTGQTTTPTNLHEIEEEAEGILIRDAYWIENMDNQERTTLIPFNQERAFLKILFTPEAVEQDVEYKIGVYEDDWGPMNDDTLFVDEEWKKVNQEETLLGFNLTAALFQKGEDDIAELYFQVIIRDDDTYEFCNSDSERLRVHLIRYIPGSMRYLGWDKGAALQDEWFNRPGSNTPALNEPVTNVITMDWTLGFARAKNLYDSMITQKIWVNTAGRGALIRQIKLMSDENRVSIPDNEDQSVHFGVFEDTIVTHEGEKVPLFDKFHYQERAFRENAFFTTDDDLDDLYAALANFVFRMCVGGTITRKADHYIIRVTKVGTYVQDSFNFIDEGLNRVKSQPLGYWNIVEKKVSTKSGDGYRYVNNESYNVYRNDYGKGGDFLVFSDIKFTVASDEFQVPLNTF